LPAPFEGQIDQGERPLASGLQGVFMSIFSQSLARFAKRWTACAVSAALAASFSFVPAKADLDKRVALVIGNGAYAAAPRLDNPVNDAKAVSAALKRLGFAVVEGYDLGGSDMHAKIGEFSAALPDAKAALVYYAGHGVSVDEDNFLLPTDIVLKGPADLDLNAVNLSLVLKLMKRQDAINVIILDACRDNPFAADLARVAKNRSAVAERGLSRIDSELAKGTLIAFATDPKSTALDGMPGGHSPFTGALLAHIEDPGVPIGTVMDRVRADVFGATKSRQTPWVNTSIIGEFILNPVVVPSAPTAQVASLAPAESAPATLASERLSLDDKLWASAEKSNTAEDYKAYLDAMPSGAYAPMAKNRIARLTGAPALQNADRAANPGEAVKAETGTEQTEATLKLDEKSRQELQARLQALGFDPGDQSGIFTPKTRAAIAAWQKGHEAAPTTWLGPIQYAALVQESEAPLQKMRAAQAAAPTSRKPAPKPHVVANAPAAKKRRVPLPSDAAGYPPRQTYAAPPPDQRANQAAGAFLGGVLLGGALGGITRYH
jgi:uncharacterized caspase-like protein